MAEKTFEEFTEKVMAIALDFAKSKNAIIKCGKPNEEKMVFELGISPIKEGFLYHFINNSDDNPVYYLMFLKEDDEHFRIYIDSARRQLQQGLTDNLQRASGFKNNDINKNLDEYNGDFAEKMKFYLAVMWNAENWLRYAYLGLTYNENEAYFKDAM